MPTRISRASDNLLIGSAGIAILTPLIWTAFGLPEWSTLVWMTCAFLCGAPFGFWFFSRHADAYLSRLRGQGPPDQRARPLRLKDALWFVPACVLVAALIAQLEKIVRAEHLEVLLAGLVGWSLGWGLLMRQVESTAQRELDDGRLDSDVALLDALKLSDWLGVQRTRFAVTVCALLAIAGIVAYGIALSTMRDVTAADLTRESIRALKTAVAVWLPIGTTSLALAVVGAIAQFLSTPFIVAHRLHAASKREAVALLNMGQQKRMDWDALCAKYQGPAPWPTRASAILLALALVFACILPIYVLHVSLDQFNSADLIEWFVGRLMIGLLPIAVVQAVTLATLLLASFVFEWSARRAISRLRGCDA
ncbi:hypothetical protein FDZ71_00500 [bacterium]|nr:MAG: hypothetical protein FDZ71_00500 [bacterium]